MRTRSAAALISGAASRAAVSIALCGEGHQTTAIAGLLPDSRLLSASWRTWLWWAIRNYWRVRLLCIAWLRNAPRCESFARGDVCAGETAKRALGQRTNSVAARQQGVVRERRSDWVSERMR